MRVAVLGSGSFAGGDFVDLLLGEGTYDVLAIGRSAEKPPALRAYAPRSRDRFQYRQLDLNRDPEEIRVALDAFAPEFVVNFAAQGDDVASWTYPGDYFQTNCVALARLVDHLKDRPYLRRFLQISSSGVYGNPPRRLTEDTRLDPGSPYGVSKAAADLMLFAYHANFGFPAQVIRPPNLYGPYQQLFRIIPKSIVTLKRGDTIGLHGGGYAVRSYVHVRDSSRAALTILERGEPGEAYNIAPKETHRVRDVVAVVCELLQKDFVAATRAVEDRRGQTTAQDLDSAKIRKLGWRPQISLRDGIAQVLDWIERDWSELIEQPLVYIHKR